MSPGTYTFESTPKGWELYHGNGGITSAVAVKIVNPSSTQFTLTYFIDGQLYRLEPGKTHDIDVDPTSTIEFGRGGDNGTAKQRLTGGTYAFESTAKGWDLRQIGEGATQSGTMASSPGGAEKR